MQASAPARGVKGLFPLLRKNALECLQPLERYYGLKLARIAIDATLLTQKFFYADASPAGHLKGFAHVLTALKRVRAVPIMVFDHPTARLPAKMQEHKRRLDLRALTAFRCKVEASRSPRLDALLHAVDMFEQLQPTQRWDVGFALRGEPVRKDDALLAALLAEAAAGFGCVPSAPGNARVGRVHEPYEAAHDPDIPLYTEANEALDSEEYYTENQPFVLPSPARLWSTHQIVAAVRALRAASYEESQTLTESMTESATQRTYRWVEENIYRALQSNRVGPDGRLFVYLPERLQDVLPSYAAAWLRKKSADLLASYVARTRVPAPEMYTQCIELCRLLDVPVFVVGDGSPTGGDVLHEAEAFASSLVAQGFADMVASEDSDVLLYHVPLLRGLGSQVYPCELIDAQRMRAALFPDDSDKRRRAKLHQLALLCGTDFNRTVPLLGPVSAYREIKFFGSIERILARAKFRPPGGLTRAQYLAELEPALHVLEHPPDVAALARNAGLVPSAPSGYFAPAWAKFLRTYPTPVPAPAAFDPSETIAYFAAHGVEKAELDRVIRPTKW